MHNFHWCRYNVSIFHRFLFLTLDINNALHSLFVRLLFISKQNFTCILQMIHYLPPSDEYINVDFEHLTHCFPFSKSYLNQTCIFFSKVAYVTIQNLKTCIMRNRRLLPQKFAHAPCWYCVAFGIKSTRVGWSLMA